MRAAKLLQLPLQMRDWLGDELPFTVHNQSPPGD
jgi:hypothetical protein